MPTSNSSPSSFSSYLSRGYTSLILAWALAGSFLFGSYTLIQHVWPQIAPSSSHIDDPIATKLMVASALANTIPTILLNLFYLILYCGNFPSVEKLKIGKAVWPWRSQYAEIRNKFWALIPYSLLRVILNNLVSVPVVFFMWKYLFPASMRANIMSKELPSFLNLMLQLTFCTLVEDLLFYTNHRFLHSVPFLYKHVHSIHHQYHIPISLAAEHAHIFEFLVGNLLPATAGAFILQSHITTLWLFIVIRVFVSVEEHGGYDFPWSPVRLLPFGSATAAGHDFHHSNDGKAIFGSQFHYLDSFFGTDMEFESFIAKRKDESKKTR
jgi:sterol desaturase/sphingolipid hydroxylase (fatty acid hydroxylase superfamily)